ncbi:MAG: mono/diheme cytochrome c family protein [Planctomycetota bacterium]
MDNGKGLAGYHPRMSIGFHLLHWLASLSLLAPAATASACPSGDDEVDEHTSEAYFEGDVFPILEEHCLECHGLGKRIRGGLKLTSRDGVLAGGDSGAAVDLQEPQASHLLAMLSYRDSDHEMPPSGKLDDAEIIAIERWLQLGVPWSSNVEVESGQADSEEPSQQKWGYGTLRRPELPKVSDRALGGNPIDAFLQAALENEGLTLSPAANKTSLIRRATFDLIGLPPTPEEVEAFVSDSSPDAFEVLIERLLKSPRYGEKWGRHWLDLVRYAETNGFERDANKPFIWRYRDYVIDAFNADKPYDQFILEQLAGDELDEVTPESITATGYTRLMQWDDEPGQGRLQARYDTLDDLVSTTSQVFLGVTLGCARCHDHKKDPITQADYYSFMAFFHNLTDLTVAGTLTEIATLQERNEYERGVGERATQTRALEDRLTTLESDFRVRIQELDALPPAITGLGLRSYRGSWDKLPDFDALASESSVSLPAGFFDVASARDGIGGLVLEGTLWVPESGDYMFVIEATGGARLSLAGATVIEQDSMGKAGMSRQETIGLSSGVVPIRLEVFGTKGKPRLHAWWNRVAQEEGQASGDAATQPWPLSVAAAHGELKDVHRWIETRGPEVWDEQEVGAWKEVRGEWQRTQRREVPIPRAFAAHERGSDMPPLHVHVRGNAAVKGDEAKPRFPALLDLAPRTLPTASAREKSTGYRRVLAEWIANPANPMTARVMANRLWQFHFGRGIVRTPHDFGGLGEGSSNPQLLDWLAVEFIERGWSLKAMHRLIMSSKAYQMSSRSNEAALEIDPANDLWWRFDMRRLAAEEMRDTMIALTGRLNPKMHGPSFFSRMPAEALATSSTPDRVWGTSPLEETFRRSIYIKVKRSLMTPILERFDVADTDSTCAVRFATTQPTQALSMLNGAFVREMASRMADRLRKEVGVDAEQQVRLATHLALGREASPAEVVSYTEFLAQLTAESEAAPDASMASDPLADLCLVFLNLNELAYVD